MHTTKFTSSTLNFNVHTNVVIAVHTKGGQAQESLHLGLELTWTRSFPLPDKKTASQSHPGPPGDRTQGLRI